MNTYLIWLAALTSLVHKGLSVILSSSWKPTYPVFQLSPLLSEFPPWVGECSILNHCQPNELYAVALAKNNYRMGAERIRGSIGPIVLYSWEANVELKIASWLVNIQSKGRHGKNPFVELCFVGTPFPRSELDHLRNCLLAMRSLKSCGFQLI